MEILSGKIIDWREDGTILISATIPNLDVALKRQYSDVEIGIDDGRKITPEQRRKTYALINEIAEWQGEFPETVKQFFKMDFVLNRLKQMERTMFSLSNCSVTTAREFINFLVDFIITHDVPTRIPLIENVEDIGRYVYAVTAAKKCAVCGRPGELHHVDKIGMGRNRDEVYQIGMNVMCLCREHHTETHTIGEKSFLDKYHLEPVILDDNLAKIYTLTKKNRGSNNETKILQR